MKEFYGGADKVAYSRMDCNNEINSEPKRYQKFNDSQILCNYFKNKKLEITFITESPFWSPGLQILNEINSLCECEKSIDDKERRLYEYSNGLILKNYLFDKIDVEESDAVFVIFDARNKKHIDPKWRDIVINIIHNLKENKVILIGIRISNELEWSDIMNEFNVNEYLEEKIVSLLFFKIGSEYRLEIYDELEVMFSTIINS